MIFAWAVLELHLALSYDFSKPELALSYYIFRQLALSWFSGRVPPRHFGFATELYASGAKFVLKIFYPFWAPTTENYELVFLIAVRPNGASDRCAPKTCIRSFWGATMRQIFKNFDLERLWTFKPIVTRVSLLDFLPLFGAPRPEITNQSFWSACDQKYIRSFWPVCDQERP